MSVIHCILSIATRGNGKWQKSPKTIQNTPIKNWKWTRNQRQLNSVNAVRSAGQFSSPISVNNKRKTGQIINTFKEINILLKVTPTNWSLSLKHYQRIVAIVLRHTSVSLKHRNSTYISLFLEEVSWRWKMWPALTEVVRND